MHINKGFDLVSNAMFDMRLQVNAALYKLPIKDAAWEKGPHSQKPLWKWVGAKHA